MPYLQCTLCFCVRIEILLRADLQIPFENQTRHVIFFITRTDPSTFLSTFIYFKKRNPARRQHPFFILKFRLKYKVLKEILMRYFIILNLNYTDFKVVSLPKRVISVLLKAFFFLLFLKKLEIKLADQWVLRKRVGSLFYWDHFCFFFPRLTDHLFSITWSLDRVNLTKIAIPTGAH